MNREIIKFENCSINTSSDDCLKDFYFHMNEGCINGIIGTSGSGMSAFYEYLIGKAPLEHGRVTFMGKPCGVGERFPYATSVVCIGKKSTLIPSLSVAENIFIINRKRRGWNLVNRKNVNFRARMLLSQFAPDISPTMFAKQLTPAQAIVVELLRAIENEVNLVFIDDVLQGYGQSDMAIFGELLTVIQNRGISIIYTGHEPNAIIKDTDKIYLIDKGQIVRSYTEKNYNSHQFYSILYGKDKDFAFTRTSHKTDRIKMSVEKDLSMNRHFSLTAHEGEIVGLYDMNNVENNKIVASFIEPLTDPDMSIVINEKSYSPKGIQNAIQNKIGYISSDSYINPLVSTMNFMENLSLPLIAHNKRLLFYSASRFMKLMYEEFHEKIGVDYSERNKKAAYLDSDTTMSIFYQKWLLFKPEVMIFSDPFVDMDLRRKTGLYEFMNELAAQGTVVIVSSQSMKDLRNVCDNLYVINENDETIINYHI